MTTDVIHRIDDLNEELRTLGQAILNLRYEDFKRTFCDQLQRAVEDYSFNRLQPDVAVMSGSSECSMREVCTARMIKVIASAVAHVRSDEPMKAWEMLDEVERVVAGDSSPCQDSNCTAYALRVLARAKTSVELFQEVRARMLPPEVDMTPHAHAQLRSEDAARFIDPLANPKRLDILRLLARQEMGFSDISRETGMKTGHLQFHLRPLVGAGYVDSSGKGKTYRITLRGREALQGIDELVDRLCKTI